MAQNTSINAKTRARLMPGDIASVQADSIRFAIIKVLAIDEDGVYGLLYSHLFTARPRIVNIQTLQISRSGPIHFALNHDLFAQCRPELITHKEVTEDELRECPLWTEKNPEWRQSTEGEGPSNPGIKNCRIKQ
jgi:hypothetical protein